jgi:CheY-like chemotaxis protein
MFELFAQGERGLDRNEGGLGVGLTLSRRLVEMHGGTLQGRSAGTGRGSEFVVRMPVFTSEAVPSAGPAQPRPARPAGGGRVLVVDDNADSAESTALLMQMWGLEVRIAPDGPEGLRLVKAFRPHCVILDLGLPRMDGFEVARRIRRTPGLGGEALMLIAVTGYGQKDDRDRTRRAGFDHHFTKPVDLDRLRELLLGRVPSLSASGS